MHFHSHPPRSPREAIRMRNIPPYRSVLVWRRMADVPWLLLLFQGLIRDCCKPRKGESMPATTILFGW